jgi:hypothetical protein
MPQRKRFFFIAPSECAQKKTPENRGLFCLESPLRQAGDDLESLPSDLIWGKNRFSEKTVLKQKISS